MIIPQTKFVGYELTEGKYVDNLNPYDATVSRVDVVLNAMQSYKADFFANRLDFYNEQSASQARI